MNVLLLRMPYNRLKGVAEPPFHPEGMAALGAIARSEGHKTLMYNMECWQAKDFSHSKLQDKVTLHETFLRNLQNDEHPAWTALREILATFQPDIVGLTVLTIEYKPAVVVSKIVKSWRPQTFVVWGGAHSTIMPESVLEHDTVDFVVRGEGETVFRELLTALDQNRDPSEIRGLSFRHSDGSFQHNDFPPLVANLDDLPLPNREDVAFPDQYRNMRMASLTTTRGCPYRCAYCSAPDFWHKKTRFKSVSRIMQDLLQIKRINNPDQIMFWDDNFTLRRKRVLELCAAIRAAKLNIPWRCGTRADLIDEELLDAMREAGCVKIDLGIETGSQRMLSLIGKDITVEKIEWAFESVRNAGIAPGCFLMAGFPDETEEDLKQTFDFIRRVKTLNIIFSVFYPLPGTDLYERTRELGLLPEEPSWSEHSIYTPTGTFIGGMEQETFQRLISEMIQYIDHFNNSPGVKLREMQPLFRYLLTHNPRILARKLGRISQRFLG